jgi:hypothetical protein
MQAQDFSQQAQVQAAQDAINRFNTMNSQQVGNQNVAASNAAQQYNLNNQMQQNLNNQQISNMQGAMNTQANLAAINEANANQKAKAGILTSPTNFGANTLNAANQSSAYANLLGTAGTQAKAAANLINGTPATTTANSGALTTDTTGLPSTNSNSSDKGWQSFLNGLGTA